MNTLVKNWQQGIKDLAKEKSRLDELQRQAELAEIPEKLRPAEAKDIVEGAIIWYPEYRDVSDELHPCRGWQYVSEVYRPNDDFKAYCSHDGCRHGLDGAFVEL
jgi:hypothetical protein